MEGSAPHTPEPEQSNSELLKLIGKNEHLQSENRKLWGMVKEMTSADASAEALINAIEENMAVRPEVKPQRYIPKARTNKLGGMILDIGDVHFGEVVSERNTGGYFKYDTDIAERRYNHTIDEAIEIAKYHRLNELRMVLGGDDVSGMIHDDLNRSNEMMVAEQTIKWSEVCYGGIEKILSAGIKIDITRLSGNHGRNYPFKPYFKNKAQENYDWLVGKMLEQYGKNQKGLNIEIPDTIWASFEVANRRFLAMHGDTVRFQKSMGISFYAIEKEMRRLKTMVVDGTIPAFNDVLGHHQHMQFAVPIGNSMWYNNGSLKGGDEYGHMGLRPPEQAQQQMLIIEEGKVKAHYPIVSEHIK